MQYRSDALRVVSADYLGQANQRDGPNPGRTLATASLTAVISLDLAGRILTLLGAEANPAHPGSGYVHAPPFAGQVCGHVWNVVLHRTEKRWLGLKT